MDTEKLINRAVVNNEPVFVAYLHSKAAAAGVPVSATFELTARCNFNCRMCYVHSQDSVLCKAQEKSAEWWIALGKEAIEQGVVFLLLTGGEPLLRKDFKEIYTELSKLGFIISINTNGYLITDEIVTLFRKNPPARLNISLYGANDKTYENITGLPAFSRVIENVKKLIDIGTDIRFNGSFTNLNACDAEKIYNISRELNVYIKGTQYMFPPVLAGGKYGDNPCRLSPEDAAQKRVEWLKLIYTPEEYKMRLKSMVEGVDAFELSGDEECGEGKVKCRAGKSSTWVNFRGEMCFCGIAGHSFSIDEYGFNGAWEKVKEFSASIRTPARCEGCRYKNICCVCAAACYTETGDFSAVPAYICRMTECISQLMKKETEGLE
ncbi:MAG: radical SAM protein [Clostridia bacterium]|nr:radical SAM protein [Clostridia bacterium]